MPNTNTSHLERHHNKWRVVVRVPNAVRELIGKAHLKESLDTTNLATANLLKPDVVARLKRQIEEAMFSLQQGPEFDEARAIRAANNKALNLSVPFARLERPHEEPLFVIKTGRQDASEPTLVRPRPAGKATPLKTYMAEFTTDQGYQPKSLLEMERTLRRLGGWLVRNGHWQTLEAVTPEVGTAFMRHYVQGLGMSRKSAAKYVSFMRSYWKWLVDHHHLPPGTAPWSSPLPRAKTSARHDDLEPDEGKRAYRADELKKLLDGPADAHMLDLIKIAALTGMRLEEIYRLRARDVSGGELLPVLRTPS